ncbi:hypothetical protein HA402_012909 [Bradysia odoriphaga]|nr:hypothetical protein HA402_012909 [Bradysia odoriphaga]
MRRSQRILEKKLKSTFALPDNESDSENEGDVGAKEELNQINNVDGEYLCEPEIDLCEESSNSDNENESSDEFDDIDSSDEEGWNHNSNVLEEINLEFKSPSVVGIVGGNEIDYFEKIFDASVINKVVEQTNIYAEQKQSKNWTELTVDELKAYIGCHIIMGIHKLPNLKAYWSSDPLLRVDAVANTMPENRFEKITQNLHLNNNNDILPKSHICYDKLHKVRPLLDLLNENIGKVYDPSSFVTVDESMIKFKGRCVLKQYMPLKPIKRGYKVWCLADSVTGFIIAFIVYTGKEKIITESTLGERVVMTFAQKLKPGSIVVVDNFFTSYSLLQNLKKKGIYACGTVRSTSKGLPGFMRKMKKNSTTKQKKHSTAMARGEFQFKIKNGVAAVQWMDKKPVNFLSSAHTPRRTTTVLRRLQTGKRISVHCPNVVADYNKYMCGVDRFDQYRERYETGRKSIKWWFRILYFLMDLAVVNSFVLWKMQQSPGSKNNQLTYRLRQSRQLIDGFSSRKMAGRPPNFFKCKVPKELRLAKSSFHLPRVVASSRRCKLCSSKYNKQTRTKVICISCDVPLCVKNCFERFHTK